jgi:methylated-DNA-[protein]-cysteine S-methyltransferase
MRLSTVETWAGPFTVLTDDDAAVLAAGWTADESVLLALVHPRLRTAEPKHHKDLGDVTKAVRSYHEGDLRAPESIAVRQHCGGDFLPVAWRVLREVPPGATVTYTQLASRTGNPAASRAAASACARNAAALFVPCHRVIRTDGTMGGFRWGIEIKRRLISHER